MTRAIRPPRSTGTTPGAAGDGPDTNTIGTEEGRAELDRITREISAFRSFEELLTAEGRYRPSLYPDTPDHVRLADAYDAAQAERGDPRRAYRGAPGKAGAS